MSGELLLFAIYVAQQLGVMLGVGAQTLLLCTHLIAIHRHEPEKYDSSFARAARVALTVGLLLIVVSGALAVLLHAVAGNFDVLSAPAFLFKWVLIIVVAVAYALQKYVADWSNTFAWFVGGTWYALFLVHSTAPITSWSNLLFLYVAWMGFFALAWGAFIFLMEGTKVRSTRDIQPKAPAVPQPKPLPPPPPVTPKPVTPQPKPTPLPPPLVQLPPTPPEILLPAPPKVPPPAPKPAPPPPRPMPPVVPKPPLPQRSQKEEASTLPALRVMPQKAEDLGKYERGPVVQFDSDN